MADQPTIKTFRDLIDCWPSYEALAHDVKVPVGTVGSWRHHNSIPARSRDRDIWSALVNGSSARGIDSITLHLLARLAASGGFLGKEAA